MGIILLYHVWYYVTKKKMEGDLVINANITECTGTVCELKVIRRK